MTHKSISDTFNSVGTTALALTLISLDRIRESLEFKMASTITFPVFRTVSTCVRSSLSFRRYSLVFASFPDKASSV